MVSARAVEDGGVQLVEALQRWGGELGFSQIGVTGIDLGAAEPGLAAWLEAGFAGDMHYMARHGMTRARPAALVPGTVSVISARMDYLPRHTAPSWAEDEQARLTRPGEAVISVYARGRDYHKVLRSRLLQLAQRLQVALAERALQQRVFTDSAPVLEVELAARSGIGWRGKHTLALHREAGSMFFLGEVYIDLALPPTPAIEPHCGSCTRCLDVCPTRAIVAPYRLDARRCISYLTIEHAGAIPLELREAIGNRIYGCDDCQTVCPWNKFAQVSTLPDFDVRDGLVGATLLELWAWHEAEFLRRTEGSAIRRIGWQRWRRNLAVALGNARRRSVDPHIDAALQAALADASPLVAEHIRWALEPGPFSAADHSAAPPEPATHAGAATDRAEPDAASDPAPTP